MHEHQGELAVVNNYRWWPPVARHVPLAVALIVTLPLLWPTSYPGDHFTFWAAGRIVASGHSPYDARAWTDPAIDAAAATGLVTDMRSVIAQCCAVIWAYPPWTAVALAPFGALPLPLGVPLFHLTSLTAAVVAAVALARSLPWLDQRLYALALALFALSEPFIIGVRGGHFVGLLLGGVFLVQLGLLRNRLWPLVVGTVLLSLKPHAALVLAAVVLAYLLTHKRWSHIAWTSATLGAIAIPSLIAYPDSLAAIAAGSRERAGVQGGTTWTLLSQLDGAWLEMFAAALLFALATVSILSVRLAPARFRIHATVAAALVIGLAAVPYLQDHDHLLFVPALFLAVFYKDRVQRGYRWYLPGVILAFLVVPWAVQVPNVIPGAPYLAGAVPFLVGSMLLVGTIIGRRGAPA